MGFVALRIQNQSLTAALDLKSSFFFLLTAMSKPSLLIKLLKHLVTKTKQLKLSTAIDYFAVDKNFRGKGIGNLLILEAEKITASDGFGLLYTKTSNERLYRYYVSKKSAKLLKEFSIFGERYRCVCWTIK